MTTTTFIAVLIGAVFVFIGLIGWGLVMAAKLGEDPLEAEALREPDIEPCGMPRVVEGEA